MAGQPSGGLRAQCSPQMFRWNHNKAQHSRNFYRSGIDILHIRIPTAYSVDQFLTVFQFSVVSERQSKYLLSYGRQKIMPIFFLVDQPL